MATLQFEMDSPYKISPRIPPKEDIKHSQFERNFNSTTSTGTRVGFAIFGAGRAGTIHLSFLISEPQIELLYIVENDKSKWGRLKNYWNLESVKFLTNAEASLVYEDPKVHAVVITSPTFTHEEIVTKALEGNKAVFCEKPVAESFEKMKACYAKAEMVKQPLLCAFNRRFDPSFANIKERVHRGDIGKVLTVKICSRDSPLPPIEYLKNSGGIFYDTAVHDIDMSIYMLKEYPTKVMVLGKANIPEVAQIGDYDTVVIVLSFDSGSVAIIDINRHSSYGYDQRIEVFGQKGMLKAENQMPIHNVEFYTEEHVKKAPINYSFPSRYADSYQFEMRHFLEVVQGKTDLCVDSKDTLAGSRVAAACTEAAKTGKVVELTWNKEDWSSRRN